MINDAIAGLAILSGLALAYSMLASWYEDRQAAKWKAQSDKMIANERKELAKQMAEAGKPIEWPEPDEYRNYLDTGKLEVRHEISKGDAPCSINTVM